MQRTTPSRALQTFRNGLPTVAARLLLGVLAACLVLSDSSLAQPPKRPAGVASQPNRSIPSPNRATPSYSRQNPHLGQWLNNHQSLPLVDQQRALENEPGFRQLAPNQQQRYRDLLSRLNAMPPDQRQRTIARTEQLELLTPAQRQSVRSAMAQLGSLPEDRRRVVAHVFRDVRNMPDAERQQYLNSPQVRGQLNDQERGALNNLISVNPYLPIAPPPAPRPASPPQ